MTTNTRDSNGAESLASQLGLNQLGEQLQGLASAMADRGVSVVTDRLDGLTNKMTGSGSGVAGKTVKNMVDGDSAPKAALKAGVESVNHVCLARPSSPRASRGASGHDDRHGR
jgi:hypothetical protein